MLLPLFTTTRKPCQMCCQTVKEQLKTRRCTNNNVRRAGLLKMKLNEGPIRELAYMLSLAGF